MGNRRAGEHLSGHGVPHGPGGTVRRFLAGRPRRSPRMTHLCSDRVTHQKRRTLIRKPQVGKALSSPPKAGRWVRFREQTRVISRECRRAVVARTVFSSVQRGHPLLYGAVNKRNLSTGETGDFASENLGSGLNPGVERAPPPRSCLSNRRGWLPQIPLNCLG